MGIRAQGIALQELTFVLMVQFIGIGTGGA